MLANTSSHGTFSSFSITATTSASVSGVTWSWRSASSVTTAGEQIRPGGQNLAELGEGRSEFLERAAEPPDHHVAAGGGAQNKWVRCPIMIGREGPVSLIADAIRRLRADAHDGALIVLGEAGIGKTRLAEHISEVAAKAGVAAIAGRALPDAAGGPLRPVAEILLELTRDRPVPEDESLAPYAAVAASLVPHWRTPGWSDPGGRSW
jgi:hypothetical protein